MSSVVEMRNMVGKDQLSGRLPCMEMLTLSKSWLLGSFQVSKFHRETTSSPYLSERRRLLFQASVPACGNTLQRRWGLTNEPAGSEEHQVPPLKHLPLVLKVSEETVDAAHQLKT